MGCQGNILECSIYDRKDFSSFSGKFVLNYQNCLLKMKFSIQTYSNMLNSMEVMFPISALHRKYSFSENLV